MRHSHLPSVLRSRLSRDTPYPSSSSASASCSRASWCASTSAGSAPLTHARAHTHTALSMAICLCVPMGTCLTPSGRTPCHEPRSRKGESPEGREAPCVSAAAGVARSGGVRGGASCNSPRVEVRLTVAAVAAVAAAGAAAGAVTAAVTEAVTVGLGAMTSGVGAMIERQRWRALATTSVHDL